MTRTPPSARTTTRRIHWLVVVGLIVVIAAITATLGYQSQNSSSPSEAPRSERRGALSKADGVVPHGVTVLDNAIPAAADLDPDLLKTLRQAAPDAADDSDDEATRWAATAAASPHVSGDAAGIGHSNATAWPSGHGAKYGLCQIYKNEPWHHELRTNAIDHGCPRMYAGPTKDPRMQK